MTSLLSYATAAAVVAALAGWAISLACTSKASNETLPFTVDFTTDQSWRPLNDGVMGGLSEGRITWRDGMQWQGQTRLENNGGFSSVRSNWSTYDLSGMKRIVIRCKGNGGPFKLTMERSQRWWMPYLYASFDPSSDWQDVVIDAESIVWSQAFSGDFEALPVAQSLGGVMRLGFMKYDGTAQPFDLEVESIRFE